MNLIALTDLVIADNRQRQVFDEAKLVELTHSIRHSQLLHPLVLRNGNTLVAGERRSIAITMLHDAGIEIYHDSEVIPSGFAPYVDLGDLSPIEAMEAELEENTHRSDLSFQEHAAAVKKLHQLRIAQNPSHSVADTSEEVNGRSDGDFHSNVRKQLIVADHLDDPDVMKAKSLKDAFKILKAKEERQIQISRGEALPSEVIKGQHFVALGDFRSLSFPHKFDVICTDPPYGMGADEFNSGGDTGISVSGTSEHAYKDDYEHWLPLIVDFATFSYQAAAEQAHCYAFCDIDHFTEFRSIMEAAGWWVHRTPILFIKDAQSCRRVPWPEHGPRRSYEMVLYAVKGKKRIKSIKMDHFTAKTDDQLGHAAQKPIGAWVDLLSRSVSPGDRVLDCFCGTGGILPAGHSLKCIVTACDIDPAHYGIAVKRLENLE